MMKNTPHGGGGGGGTSPLYAQYGFSSPLEFDAWKTAKDREDQMWVWQNSPQYQQESGPSYGAQIGGAVLGTGLGILGDYASSFW